MAKHSLAWGLLFIVGCSGTADGDPLMVEPDAGPPARPDARAPDTCESDADCQPGDVCRSTRMGEFTTMMCTPRPGERDAAPVNVAPIDPDAGPPIGVIRDDASMAMPDATNPIPDASEDASTPPVTACSPNSAETARVFGIGGPNLDQVTGIVRDGAGNVYVVGMFSVELHMPGGAIRALDRVNRTFVASFGTDGNARWLKDFPGIPSQCHLAIDGNDQIYVALSLDSEVDLEGHSMLGPTLLSLDRDGRYRFHRGVTTGVRGLVVDGDRVHYGGALGFPGPGGLLHGIFTMDLSGNAVDSVHMPDGIAAATAIVRRAGGFYATGNIGEAIDHIGDVDLAPLGDTDIFLFSIDDDGTLAWARRFGGAAGETTYSIAIDGDENVYIAGSYSGAVDLGGGPTPAAGQVGFLASYTNTGAFRFARDTGGLWYGQRVIVRGDDLYFMGTVGSAEDPCVTDEASTVIWRMTLDGQPLRSISFLDPWTFDLFVDEDGTLLAGGEYSEGATFGATSLTMVDAMRDAFVFEIDEL